MEKIRLMSEAIPADSAIQQLKARAERSCIWLPVVNKMGAMFELSAFIEHDKLVWIAYIPQYTKSGEPIAYQNGFVHADLCITTRSGGSGNINLKEDEFFDVIQSTDFRKPWYDIEEIEHITVSYKTVHKIKQT